MFLELVTKETYSVVCSMILKSENLFRKSVPATYVWIVISDAKIASIGCFNSKQTCRSSDITVVL